MSDEGFIQSGRGATVSDSDIEPRRLRGRNPWERHVLSQPYLIDFIPTQGEIPENAVEHFMTALQWWLEEEKRLRAIWRTYPNDHGGPWGRDE